MTPFPTISRVLKKVAMHILEVVSAEHTKVPSNQMMLHVLSRLQCCDAVSLQEVHVINFRLVCDWLSTIVVKMPSWTSLPCQYGCLALHDRRLFQSGCL